MVGEEKFSFNFTNGGCLQIYMYDAVIIEVTDQKI